MGTKRPVHNVRKDTKESLSVPPGFASLTSFTLKRIKSPESADAKSISVLLSHSDIENFKASLWKRPWILHDQSDCNPKDIVTQRTEVEMTPRVSASLPKGVIRGCPNCNDCVKVNATWHPGEPHLPELDDAPVFCPTEEEFKDTLEYIAKIRPQAENFGICRIIPPPSWKSPRLLQSQKTWEASQFSTHAQRIDGLQNLYLERKLFSKHEKIEAKGLVEDQCNNATLGYEPGPSLTLQRYEKYADDFKKQYFRRNNKFHLKEHQEPLIARIEGEYWRIVENPSEEIEVLLGADMGSETMGSGFPTRDSGAKMLPCSDYVESGWNLNNTPKLPGSLLPYGCYGASEILVPELFVGMCFASQCWRHEDHHLYSMSYMHMGDSKVWYGVPGRYCFKFMEVVRKLFPQLSKHPELLHKLVTQFSPSKLLAEGIPVYRCVQNPMEFVLTFPSAYHSEFSCGFNCSEAVCFAPVDWLPHGQNAVELYSGNCQRTLISHDMLLLQAAVEAVRSHWEYLVFKRISIGGQLWNRACRKDGILTKALQARVKLETTRREHLSSKLFEGFDSAAKRECSICRYDLYLSGVFCSCSPNKYACLRHAKQLCACGWGNKHFFSGHTITELNLLVEALEGDIKAVHSCAKKAPKSALQNGSRSNSDSVHARNMIAAVENGGSSNSSRQTRVLCSDSSRSNVSSGGEKGIVILVSDDEDE